MGGECINYGCIPSKSLITVSKLYDKARNAEKFGLKATGLTLDYGEMQKWKGEVIKKLTSGIELLLKGNHVTVMMGEAEVVDKNNISVATPSGSQTISTKNLVIATGTRPIHLPGVDWDGKLVIGSKEGLELTSAPSHLVIIGGGAIGLEFACMYQRLGSKISIVEIMDQLLPGSDPDLVRVVRRKLEEKGAKVFVKSHVTAIAKAGESATVEVATPEGEIKLESDKILQSVGRQPRTEKMKLPALGVRTDQKGYIITDERMMTNVQDIYAIGDVRGPPLLAHKASKEGIVAAECIAGLPSAADWTVVPETVFTDPEIASVGLTIEKALAAGHPAKTVRFSFGALGRALSTGEAEGFVKVVYREDNKLVLGVQIVGPEASNLISEAALAIEMGATVEDIAMTVHPHPTLPEAIMEAAESASGSPIHQLRI